MNDPYNRKTLFVRCADGRSALSGLFWDIYHNYLELPQISAVVPRSIAQIVETYGIDSVVVLNHTATNSCGCGGLEAKARMTKGEHLQDPALEAWIGRHIAVSSSTVQAWMSGYYLSQVLPDSCEITLALAINNNLKIVPVGIRPVSSSFTMWNPEEVNAILCGNKPWRPLLSRYPTSTLSQLLEANEKARTRATAMAEEAGYGVNQTIRTIVLNATLQAPESTYDVRRFLGYGIEPIGNPYFTIWANPKFGSVADGVVQLGYALQHAGHETNIVIIGESKHDVAVLTRALTGSEAFQRIQKKWRGSLQTFVTG